MTLTTTLLTQVVADLKTDLQTIFTHGAVGDDDTAPTAADVALGNETFRDTIDEFDTAQTSAVVASLRIGTAENNGNNIDEVGFLDAAVAGNLWTRNILGTTITKTADIQVFLDNRITMTVSEV